MIGRRGVSGYSDQFFIDNPTKKDIPAIVYVVRMQHKNDDFLKIGITKTHSVKERYYNKSKNGTIITPLIEKHDSLFNAFYSEQFLLGALSNYRYYPNRKFGGYTECLKINEYTIKYLEHYFNINISNKIYNI